MAGGNFTRGFAAREIPRGLYGGSAAARSPAHESRQLRRLIQMLRLLCLRRRKRLQYLMNYLISSFSCFQILSYSSYSCILTQKFTSRARRLKTHVHFRRQLSRQNLENEKRSHRIGKFNISSVIVIPFRDNQKNIRVGLSGRNNADFWFVYKKIRAISGLSGRLY